MNMYSNGTLRITLWGVALMLAASALQAQMKQNAVHFHTGTCDGSAAVALSKNTFVVANDEDNTLRVYSREAGGGPVAEYNFDIALGLGRKPAEMDIEAATRIGDVIYWITSHGRNKSGKARPERQRIFATRLSTVNGVPKLILEGRPHRTLLSELLATPSLAKFGLAAAATKPPKSKDALNIEGLCATPEGELLIGFRNPIPQGKALIVPLKNPAGVIQGQRSQFGEPIQVDLGGQGIRDMAWVDGQYVIIAGAIDGDGISNIYTWDGKSPAAKRIEGDSLASFNPESVIFFPDSTLNDFYLLSDDGSNKVGGLECKDLKVPSQRSFRSVHITVK